VLIGQICLFRIVGFAFFLLDRVLSQGGLEDAGIICGSLQRV
jgi:hypothetical protein